MIIEKQILRKFKDRTEEIKNYIDSIEMDKIFLSKLNDENPEEKKYKEYVIKRINSTLTYNSVIISIAVCFENYIKELLEDYLEKTSKICKNYSQLCDKLRKKHKMKIGEYLFNSNRYQHYPVTEEEAIKNLYMCISGESEYKLTIPILLESGGNFKGSKLEELMSDLGIENYKQEITIDKNIQLKYENYKGDKGYKETRLAYVPLDDLINQRNLAAHSWENTSRITMEKLKEIIEYLISLGEKTYEIIDNIFLNEIILKLGHLVPISIKYFHSDKLIEVLSERLDIKEENFVYYITIGPESKKNIKRYEIESIRSNGEFSVIKINRKIKNKGGKLYKLNTNLNKEN